MRIEDLILTLRARQFTVMETVFKTPPQDYESFVRQLGRWSGIGEALSVIEELRKKDGED